MSHARVSAGGSARVGSAHFVIGIEIGGRGQRVVVADDAGHIVGEARAVDANAHASVVLETVLGLIDQAHLKAGVDLSDVAGIGIAFSGPVDTERGLTLLSHRAPGFEDFPLVNLIEDGVGIPAVLDNNARAAALGEMRFGTARGVSNLVYVHLGAGVGGGIIVDGRLLRGVSRTAGEIGHMVVSDGGPVCSCGKPGHLEAYAAAPSILRRFRDRATADQTSASDPVDDRLTVRAVFEASRRGSMVAREIVDETVHVLGVAIANLITVLNPAAVVIGGVVGEVGPLLIGPLGARVRQYSYPSSAKRVRLAASELGSNASAVGAVALALSAFPPVTS